MELQTFDIEPHQSAATSAPAERSLPSASLRADTDAKAIETWIAARCEDTGLERIGRPGHTERAYRKEALRFLMWLRWSHGLSLADVRLEDCLAYRRFLADPQPRSVWCGPRGARIASAAWRPFEGPLSPRSRRQTIVVLASLYRFLHDQGYLRHNPWSAVALPRDSDAGVNTGRSLSARQWSAIEQGLLSLDSATTRKRQLAWAIRLLYATGLRRSELCAARCGDLRWIEFDTANGEPHGSGVGGTWVLHVLGKGMRHRDVPIRGELVGPLGDLLEAEGNPRDPRDCPARPLLVAARGHGADKDMGYASALADQSLYRQLKGFFSEVARDLERSGRRDDARIIARASVHWLRHTHGSHSVAAGVPLDVVQRGLGHSSLSTTTIYTTPELSRRAREAGRLAIRTRV